MGGAVAQIASLHIATRLGADKIGGVVGFASPRAGDSGYRELYNSVLGTRHLKFRAGSDPVSNVPPGSLGYTDVGTTGECAGTGGCGGCVCVWRGTGACWVPLKPVLESIREVHTQDCVGRYRR